VARFYGWLPSDIDNLTPDEFFTYQNSIFVIEAKEKLQKLEVADYPNLKDDARKRIFNAAKKKLDEFRVKDKKQQQLSNEDIFRMISGRL